MKINQVVTESQMTCSECGGPAFSDLILAEKQDACYNKVRSRYKVWPSAYASGALVQCRKKGAANWGNKTKNESVTEGANSSGKGLAELQNFAKMNPDMTMAELANSPKKYIVANAVGTCNGLYQHYTNNKQAGNAEFIKQLAQEIKWFAEGNIQSQDSPTLGDLLQGKLGKINFQQGVAEGLGGDLNEFAPPGSGDDDGGFDENTLKRMAAQWWQGDEDPRVEKTLAAAGWEIGQDEGYDNGGVFVVRAGDENGNTYTSWAAEELEGLAEGDPGYDKHSFIGKIRRSREADNKGWGQLGQQFAANSEEEYRKALRKGNRYYNMTRGDNKTPGGFPKTTVEEQGMAEGMMGNPDQPDSPVAQAIIRRILMQRTDLLAKYGPGYVGQAVDDVADSVGDWDEIGSSDVSGWVRQVEHNLKNKLNQYDEPMDEDYNPEYDDEAGMADNNLETLQRAVEGIDDLIQSGDNLPEWCQEKIAVAKSMLVAVWDYMYSEEASDEVDPEIDAMYEAMDQLAEEIAAREKISADLVWESFEALDDHMLYETAAWRRKEGKSKSGGLNAKGVASYRRENPGSKLQMAVTTKPSKLKKGSKAAKRRKSFCARMSGVKGPMKKPNGKPTRKALALRKWNC